MTNQSLFSNDIFDELNRLQREVQRTFEFGPSIRGMGRGGYPSMNVGNTPQSLELYAFAPGLDPAKIELNLESGALSISGERNTELPKEDGKATLHMHERFGGRFRRVLNLPEDVDPNSVSAAYRDGVLRVSVKRSESAQPRRITIQ